MATNQQRELFRRLVHDHMAELYRFAFWQTRNAETAEDLVQEAYLEAWRSIGQLRQPERGRAWILQILRHRFLHWLRSKHRRPEVVADLEVLEHHGESKSDLARDIGSRVDLERAMGRIDDRYRETFLLVFLQGFSCREAAEILEVPLGTVLSRIHRARGALREQLMPEQINGPKLAAPSPFKVLRREGPHGR